MSNSILTKNEMIIISEMIDYLRLCGKSRLADQCKRVFDRLVSGALTRQQALLSVIRVAAFKAVALASSDFDSEKVLKFSIFLEKNGECSRNKNLYKPVCSDHHNCPGWIQGFGCDFCDYRPV